MCWGQLKNDGDLRLVSAAHREAWTLDRLIYERLIALGSALDKSTYGTYSSALNSYLTFCKLHNRPVEPTEDTLSFYGVFSVAAVRFGPVFSEFCRTQDRTSGSVQAIG
jgi:hypothetical protein